MINICVFQLQVHPAMEDLQRANIKKKRIKTEKSAEMRQSERKRDDGHFMW